MTINKRLGTVVLMLAFCSAWAQHLSAGHPAPKVPDGPTLDFVKADKNGDGTISKEEALTVPDLTSAFEMLDSDADALLSPAEFARWDRAGKVEAPRPRDPATAPSGSAGSQHMPKPE
jgi:hypothetical protein